MLEIEFTPRAIAQIERAAAWWVESRPAAPEAIRCDLEEATSLLAQQPSIGARSVTSKYPELTPPFFVEGQVSRLLSRHTQKSSDGCFLAGKQMHYFEPLNEDDIEQSNGADAVKVRHFYFTLVAGAGHRER